MEIKGGPEGVEEAQHPCRIAGNGDPRDSLTVEFRSLQMLQRFSERVRSYRSALENILEIVKSLMTLNTNIREFTKAEDQHLKISWHLLNSALEQHCANVHRHIRNVDDLLAKIEPRAKLVSFLIH